MSVFETRFGWVGIKSSNKGLEHVTLPQNSKKNAIESLGCGRRSKCAHSSHKSLRRDLIAYFNGEEVRFNCPVDLDHLSPFVRKVLKVVRTIPYGETRSYSWVAQKTGGKRFARAAGMALAKNTLPVVIPCHRVLRNDGSIGGFTGGIFIKKKLLLLEQKVCRMLKPDPPLVKLVVGMLSPTGELFAQAEELLSQKFGAVDFSSRLLPFAYTKYYDKEMGNGIFRKFISFRELINADSIAEIKIFTCGIEKQFSSPSGSRRINLDPGYISAAKLVLATTKNYDHRIYLKDGIYAEVTLSFRDHRFQPCDWTYPDYRTDEYIKIFNEIRKSYLDRLKTPYRFPN